MNDMKAKFDETVSILVKAFLDGTLAHADCAACAVGNIIAAKIGAKIVCIENVGYGGAEWERDGDWLTIGWPEVFCTRNGDQVVQPGKYLGQIKRQIDASGYTWRELAKIESAFEAAHNPESNRDEAGEPVDQLNPEWMFNGLMAVVDVLAEIHNIDLAVKESAKLLFVQ